MRSRYWIITRRWLRELLRALLDGLCPPQCPACGDPASGLCLRCRVLLERRAAPWCARCGEPVLGPGAQCQLDHRHLRGIELARAPFRYRGTGGALVRRLKFRHDRCAAAFLARAMAACLHASLRGPRRQLVLVSVPLHARKRRSRGIDQAAWLADEVALRLDLDRLPGCLARLRETLPQGDPRVTSRERNVAGAFAVARPRAVRGRRVVLVDDVVTSGTTARECARLLRDAGARSVWLLTGARS